MAKATSVDLLSPQEACSRSEFQAQRAKLEALLRDAGRAALKNVDASAGERRTAEMTLERDIEHRLQRLILRAKGMVSEKMLVQHRREIPVDEIPDYAVTHLLVELGEQELRSGADQ
jgi:hypothetical protein